MPKSMAYCGKFRRADNEDINEMMSVAGTIPSSALADFRGVPVHARSARLPRHRTAVARCTRHLGLAKHLRAFFHEMELQCRPARDQARSSSTLHFEESSSPEPAKCFV
jgi:hypothetical protein